MMMNMPKVLTLWLKHCLCWIWGAMISCERFFKSSGRETSPPREILVICCTGLGNTILAMPLILGLRTLFGTASLDVMVADGASAELLAAANLCNRIYLFPTAMKKHLSLFKRLRSNRYDLALLTFPTFSLVFQLLPWLLRSGRNVCHNYQQFLPFFRHYRSLYKDIIEVDEEAHDVEQNLALLKAFVAQAPRFTVYPPLAFKEEQLEFARKFFAANDIQHGMRIVIHPGSKKGTVFKRWPVENYVALAGRLQQHFKAHIIFIIGPDEQDLREAVIKDDFVVLQSNSILSVLAAVKECDIFISNDSGMMHASSLLDMPIFTLWGGTDKKRNSARASRVVNIVNDQVTCRPCVKFLPDVTCDLDDCRCITGISVDMVFKTIQVAIRPTIHSK
jgi:ADP-heptose:LPS heptosyltransferase